MTRSRANSGSPVEAIVSAPRYSVEGRADPGSDCRVPLHSARRGFDVALGCRQLGCVRCALDRLASDPGVQLYEPIDHAREDRRALGAVREAHRPRAGPIAPARRTKVSERGPDAWPRVAKRCCHRRSSCSTASVVIRHRDAAERELRRIGHRIHRRSQPAAAEGTGIAALTKRELEIARRIVDRQTNRQIAEELFLSRRPSRRTSATSSASSAPTHASRSRGWSSRPTASRHPAVSHPRGTAADVDRPRKWDMTGETTVQPLAYSSADRDSNSNPTNRSSPTTHAS
jgi:Bacterial regulatory proteins, luxR family